MNSHKNRRVRPSIEVLEDRLTLDATLGGHNKAGFISSTFASPNFGPAVAYYAQLQAVDNFGFANNGLNGDVRQNP